MSPKGLSALCALQEKLFLGKENKHGIGACEGVSGANNKSRKAPYSSQFDRGIYIPQRKVSPNKFLLEELFLFLFAFKSKNTYLYRYGLPISKNNLNLLLCKNRHMIYKGKPKLLGEL